jgi:hypothetical protein
MGRSEEVGDGKIRQGIVGEKIALEISHGFRAISLQLPIPEGWSPRGSPNLRGFSEAGDGNASGFARGLNVAGRAARLTAGEIGWAAEPMRASGLESNALAC